MTTKELEKFNFKGDYQTMVDKLTKLGFKGFKPILYMKDKDNRSEIPDEGGVYIVLRRDADKAEFKEIGMGGFFKGRNPNVSIYELNDNWVEDTPVMYIGKAKEGRLRKRISEYMRFGCGKKVGHWGGRLIWQLADADDLVVCWSETEEDSREVEKDMICKFKEEFGAHPFANLKD